MTNIHSSRNIPFIYRLLSGFSPEADWFAEAHMMDDFQDHEWILRKNSC